MSYPCCNKTFKTAEARDQHQANDPKHKPLNEDYECLCGREFSSLQALEQHKTEHIFYECDLCDQEFDSKQALEQHRDRDDCLEMYECGYCGEDFSEHDLDLHEKYCSSEFRDFFGCLTCGKEFTTGHALDQHISDEHPPTYDCPHCDQVFKSDQQQAYDQHLRDKHASKEHVCFWCNRDLYSRQALIQHTKDKHNTAPRCYYCERKFSTDDDLDQHMREKHPSTFNCFFCDREFKSQGGFDSHTKVKHPSHGFVPWEENNCLLCGYKSRSLQALNQHMKKKHFPSFNCDSCDQTFLTDHDLDQHTRDEHPSTLATVPHTIHNCLLCLENLPSKQALDKHTRVMHNPPVECVPCTDEPHKCMFCDEEFVTEGLLEKHRREQHPKYSWVICRQFFVFINFVKFYDIQEVQMSWMGRGLE